jgi:cysteinyl-tRNA synthetase
VFIIDLFVGDQSLTEADVFALATKPSGARRLVICYMSIGEAENYRYYWQPAWETTPPAWLDAENPDWEGNFKVRYWEPAWQAILTGDGDSYLGRILAAGFDGVYLDIIDAFEYYEARSRQTRKI